MTKEERLKERIEGYEKEKKELNIKIRKVKIELRWLRIKRLTQRKDKMNNVKRRGRLRWE